MLEILVKHRDFTSLSSHLQSQKDSDSVALNCGKTFGYSFNNQGDSNASGPWHTIW